MPLVEANKLTGIAHRVFAAAGSSEEEAGIIANHLIEANLKGHDSHGAHQLGQGDEPLVKERAKCRGHRDRQRVMTSTRTPRIQRTPDAREVAS